MKLLIITPLPEERTLNNLKDCCTDVKYLPKCSEQDLINELESDKYDIIYTNPNKQTFILDKSILKDSGIKIICTVSTGTNHIDLKYCKRNKIKVISLTKNDVIYKISSTAEHALGLMIALIRNIPSSMESVAEGDWNWQRYEGRQLDHLKIGIVGWGRLGQMMSRYCKSLGMDVWIYDPINPAQPQSWGYNKSKSLQQLFNKCDVISLHVHLTDETKYMINKKLFKNSKVKYLINTSRGEVVNESDILDALYDSKLLGYATDVLSAELGSEIYDSELVNAMRDGQNIIITPHIGGMTKEARILAHDAIIESLYNELNGIN